LSHRSGTILQFFPILLPHKGKFSQTFFVTLRKIVPKVFFSVPVPPSPPSMSGISGCYSMQSAPPVILRSLLQFPQALNLHPTNPSVPPHYTRSETTCQLSRDPVLSRITHPLRLYRPPGILLSTPLVIPPFRSHLVEFSSSPNRDPQLLPPTCAVLENFPDAPIFATNILRYSFLFSVVSLLFCLRILALPIFRIDHVSLPLNCDLYPPFLI